MYRRRKAPKTVRKNNGRRENVVWGGNDIHSKKHRGGGNTLSNRTGGEMAGTIKRGKKRRKVTEWLFHDA